MFRKVFETHGILVDRAVIGSVETVRICIQRAVKCVELCFKYLEFTLKELRKL